MSEVIITALSSPVVIDCLGKFLSFYDFTRLRQINKKIKENVDSCQKFLIKATHTVFVVPNSYDKFYYQNPTSTLSCKRFKIIFCASIPTKALRAEPKSAAESLKNARGIQFGQMLFGHYPSPLATPEGWQTLIGDILKIVPNLQFISFHIEIFAKVKMDQMTKMIGWGPSICPIKSLSIYTAPIFRKVFPVNEIGQLAKNLQHIASVVKNLQHFSFIDDTIKISTGTEVFWGIAEICKSNSDTLTGLEIIQPPSILQVLSDDIHYSKLRVLKIRTDYRTGEALSRFILRHCPLQVLELNFSDFLPKSVYDAIANKSSALQIFHIKALSFGARETGGDWTFLAGLDSLEKVDIRAGEIMGHPYQDLATVDQIFQNLPKTVEKIYVRGMGARNPITLSDILSFPLLTEFGIRRCQNTLNDNLLKQMFRNQKLQKRIQVLEFCYCGVTGSGMININNMTNLRRLSLQGFASNQDLRRLSLKNLKYLDVSSNSLVARDGIVAAANNCVNLTALRSSWGVGQQLPGTTIRLMRVGDPKIDYYDSDDDFY